MSVYKKIVYVIRISQGVADTLYFIIKLSVLINFTIV